MDEKELIEKTEKAFVVLLAVWLETVIIAIKMFSDVMKDD